jgi:hypothetical protein
MKEITCMPEIAYTPLGRLIGHVTAVLVAMMPASGAERFFSIVFVFSCHLLFVGAYAELKRRNYHPSRNWRFYVIAAAAFIPLLGPLLVLGLLYHLQESGQETPFRISGLCSAILRLRANALVLLVVIISLLLVFAVIHSRRDPYFKKRALSGLSPQSVFPADQSRMTPILGCGSPIPRRAG